MIEMNLGPVTIAIADDGQTYLRDNSRTLDDMPHASDPLLNRDWANFFTLCALLNNDWYQRLDCEDKSQVLSFLHDVAIPAVIDDVTSAEMNVFFAGFARHFLSGHNMPMPSIDLAMQHPTMAYSTKRVLMYLLRR